MPLITYSAILNEEFEIPCFIHPMVLYSRISKEHSLASSTWTSMSSINYRKLSCLRTSEPLLSLLAYLKVYLFQHVLLICPRHLIRITLPLCHRGLRNVCIHCIPSLEFSANQCHCNWSNYHLWQSHWSDSLHLLWYIVEVHELESALSGTQTNLHCSPANFIQILRRIVDPRRF